MKYAPEPWKQSHRKCQEGTYSTEIYDVTGTTIATLSWYPIWINKKGVTTNREANAKRIVACVNALEGIKNPEIEIPAMKNMLDVAINGISKLIGHAKCTPDHEYAFELAEIMNAINLEAIEAIKAKDQS